MGIYKEVNEKDWKLFRSRVPSWQETYMEKLVNEYMELLSGDEMASKKFWKLENRLFHDKKHPGVILEMRRSLMLYNMIDLFQMNVICEEDLEGFSTELIEEIRKSVV